MKPSRVLCVVVAATLAATSSAFDFGGVNDVTQSAGVVAPGEATGTAPGANGFGTFNSPTQWTTTASSSNNVPMMAPNTPDSFAGQPPESPNTPDSFAGQPPESPNTPDSFAGQPPESASLAAWVPPSGGEQAWFQPPASASSAVWTPPSGGEQGWFQPTEAVSSASSSAWTPPSSEQQWGPLDVDCSGSSDSSWAPPNGGIEWGGLGVDCSGSNEGVWTPPIGEQGWGTLGIDCSGSSDGGWTPPSGDQGWGTLGVECSGSSEGLTPQTDPALGSSGSNADWSPETGSQAPAAGTSTTSSASVGSSTLSGSGDQDLPQPVSAASSSNTVASMTSSGAGDQGWSQAAQTTPSTAASPNTETSTSSVGGDADPTTSLYSSELTTSTSSGSGTSGNTEQQVVSDDTSQQNVAPQSPTGTSDNDWGCPVNLGGMAQAGQRVVSDTATNCDKTPVTFGKVTSRSGRCVVGDPSEYISSEYLDWVWENRIGPNADVSNTANWNVMANKNWIMDHLVANNGSMNYCIRWDSQSRTLPKTTAAKFQDVLSRHYNAWNKWLVGYNCWPFEQLKVNMVGFAARDASQFEWSDDSLGKIYEGDLDTDGVPQCPAECYRFYDSVNNVWSDTSACQGEPFDVYLHLNENIVYGFGYDWGEEVSLNNTLQNIDKKHILYIGHEIGHGFGLPDFYSEADKPARDFPNAIMMAFSSATITPNDGWMLRRVLEHLKPRYNF